VGVRTVSLLVRQRRPKGDDGGPSWWAAVTAAELGGLVAFGPSGLMLYQNDLDFLARCRERQRANHTNQNAEVQREERDRAS
jgi:hypothetical protein